MGYTKDAVKGFSWITLLRFSTRIITIIRLAILGRLLTPAQFGFFGIASLCLSLLDILTETGINVFFVQEKRDIKYYINTAWIVSIARGAIVSSIIFVFASFITNFFNVNEAYSVILLSGFIPLIKGFINPAIITYQKNLLFRNEFKLRFLLFIIEVIITVSFAFLTRDAKSFVYGLICSAFIEVIFSFVFIPLRPTFNFEFKQLRQILHRGRWVTLTGIFLYFADNGDNIIIGKILGASSLGVYQIAYKFSTLPISEITNVVNQVVFPIYTRFSEDKDRLWKAFLKVTIFSSVGSFLLGGIIFIFAKPIIFIFMGEQWVSAAPVVEVLAIYGILRTLFGNFAPLFLSVGKQEYVAQMTFFRLCGLVISIVPLVIHFGMVGAGYAMFFSMLVEIPVIVYFTNKIFSK